MERCPECRARLKGRSICGRCEADLSLLRTIEDAAAILARRAVQAFAAGDVSVAAQQAKVARELHATPFHLALAGFIDKFASQNAK